MFKSAGIGEPGMAPSELRKARRAINCPIGRYRPISKARRWILLGQVVSLRLGRGGEPCLVQILYHFVARPAGILYPLAPGARRLRLVAGFSMSKEAKAVPNTLQLPVSTGSLTFARLTIVPHSPAANSTLRPSFFRSCSVTSAQRAVAGCRPDREGRPARPCSRPR